MRGMASARREKGRLGSAMSRALPAACVCLAVVAGHAQVGRDAAEPAESAPAAVSPASGGPRRQPSETIPLAELEAFVDGAVRVAMDEHHIAGVAVAVVQDGAVALKKGYGFASIAERRVVDPDITLFRIGSITKTFTWIAAMKAVEEGRLDLDAPINGYLPAELQIPDGAFSRPIRMRDLMTHTPGFADRALGIIFENDPGQIRPLAQFLRETRPTRVHEPGAVISYSNYGVALAGAALERIRGEAWQDIVERQILQPLGMTRTSVREPYAPRDDLPAPMPASLARDLSTGYRWLGSSHAARGFEYITQTAPAGAMSSTAADMAVYMTMLLDGGRHGGAAIFGPRTAEAFRTPMTSLPREVGSLDAGFFEQPLPGGFRGYGHSGGTLSFFTNMTIVPELRLGVFVATNTEGGTRLSDRLPGRIVARFFAPPVAPPEPSLDASELSSRYAGTFLQTRRPYSGLEGFVMRLLTIPVWVTPDGFLAMSFLGQVHRLAPTGTADTFQDADSQLAVTFDRDGDGPAQRIRHVAVTLDRVGPLYQPPTILLLALLTALASAATIAGAFLRAGRRLPATRAQRAAAAATIAASVLWLASIGSLGAWATGASDIASVIYDWPAPLVIAASAAALLASVATAVAVVLLAPVWRRSASGAGWPAWRKARTSVVVLIFAAFAVVLGLWGALQPWSS